MKIKAEHSRKITFIPNKDLKYSVKYEHLKYTTSPDFESIDGKALLQQINRLLKTKISLKTMDQEHSFYTDDSYIKCFAEEEYFEMELEEKVSWLQKIRNMIQPKSEKRKRSFVVIKIKG